MKKSGFKWMSAVILSGALASYTACEEDLDNPCREIDCTYKANSTCVDGYCKCNNGYSDSADHNFCVPKENYPEACKTMVCGPHSKCGDLNNPRCICEGEYSTYNGGTDCINEVLVKCQVIEGYGYSITHGEYDKDAMVTVYFDGKNWNDGPEYRECPVKCTEDGYEPDADKANCSADDELDSLGSHQFTK